MGAGEFDDGLEFFIRQREALQASFGLSHPEKQMLAVGRKSQANDILFAIVAVAKNARRLNPSDFVETFEECVIFIIVYPRLKY